MSMASFIPRASEPESRIGNSSPRCKPPLDSVPKIQREERKGACRRARGIERIRLSVGAERLKPISTAYYLMSPSTYPLPTGLCSSRLDPHTGFVPQVVGGPGATHSPGLYFF